MSENHQGFMRDLSIAHEHSTILNLKCANLLIKPLRYNGKDGNIAINPR